MGVWDGWHPFYDYRDWKSNHACEETDLVGCRSNNRRERGMMRDHKYLTWYLA